MRLYVGTLTHNCRKYTEAMLSSFKTKYPHNFVWVDNGSTDGTLTLMASLAKYPNQIHIRNVVNKGVPAGWNQILRTCMADPEFRYVYLVNNDVVFQEGACDVLHEFLEAHPDYVAVCSIQSNTRKPTVGFVDNSHIQFVAIMLTRFCIEQVGLFDERFFPAYYEDNDYSERIKRVLLSKGYKSGMVHDSRVIHVGSRTIKEGGVNVAQSFEENKRKFKLKWGFLP
jgi:GT2 family glycosyltransferase